MNQKSLNKHSSNPNSSHLIDMTDFNIEPIQELSIKEIAPIIEASEQEGFKFLTRLKNDWISGKNRFDKTNERLYQIKQETQIIAIGGINNNPYKEDGKIGRIRHVYVLPEYKRKGIGRQLILHLLDTFADKYEKITLRTDTEAAATFYESIGFKNVQSKNHTHEYSNTRISFVE